jgi:hypothetical protein
MENMKAVRMHNYGGPEVLRFEDAPRPTPGAGELLIRVFATSVNAITAVRDREAHIPGALNIPPNGSKNSLRSYCPRRTRRSSPTAQTRIDTPANTLPVNWRRWATKTWRTIPKANRAGWKRGFPWRKLRRESVRKLSRFWCIAKKLLSHCLAECFFPKLQAHRVHRFCVCPSNIAQLVFSVGGSFVYYPGDLLRRRVGRHLLGIGDDADHFVHE